MKHRWYIYITHGHWILLHPSIPEEHLFLCFLEFDSRLLSLLSKRQEHPAKKKEEGKRAPVIFYTLPTIPQCCFLLPASCFLLLLLTPIPLLLPLLLLPLLPLLSFLLLQSPSYCATPIPIPLLLFLLVVLPSAFLLPHYYYDHTHSCKHYKISVAFLFAVRQCMHDKKKLNVDHLTIQK